MLAALSALLSHGVEVDAKEKQTNRGLVAQWSGLHESQSVVFRLSTLFALDAFGGGFIIQSVLAYWFYLRFGASNLELRWLFFAANILSGISALIAVPLPMGSLQPCGP